MNQKLQKNAGYPVFVWAVESGTFLAHLTHFGVLCNDLGMMKPSKCTKVFLKGGGNFGTTFQNFPSISFRFRHPGGKTVAATPSRSWGGISLKNQYDMCVVMTFRYSRKKTGHHTLVSPEMRKNHSQNVQFFNSVTPRLQSTDVNNILMSLLHSLLLSKHVACWQSFKLKPSWGLSVLRNDFEFSTLAFHSINVSSGHCFPMRSKVITWLVKDCCDTLISSFERDDLEQVNVLNTGNITKGATPVATHGFLSFKSFGFTRAQTP